MTCRTIIGLEVHVLLLTKAKLFRVGVACQPTLNDVTMELPNHAEVKR
jgi:Asp-tRNA(Asn)/Glu-tRNA(Gln) amidotransferase B subunit